VDLWSQKDLFPQLQLCCQKLPELLCQREVALQVPGGNTPQKGAKRTRKTGTWNLESDEEEFYIPPDCGNHSHVEFPPYMYPPEFESEIFNRMQEDSLESRQFPAVLLPQYTCLRELP